jgi:hypothetical protein
MSIEIDANHKCDESGCRSDADVCLCSNCNDKALNEAYDDGYATAKKEFEVKE